jgi:hypothetical protein
MANYTEQEKADFIQKYKDIMDAAPKDTHQATCPACGYCPHCGRGGQHFGPYPYIIPNPYPWNPYPTIVWCGTQTTSGTT